MTLSIISMIVSLLFYFILSGMVPLTKAIHRPAILFNVVF
jgi:hypothetical protein